MSVDTVVKMLKVATVAGLVLLPHGEVQAKPGCSTVPTCLGKAARLNDSGRYAEASALLNSSPEIAAEPAVQCLLVKSYLGEERYQESLNSWEICDRNVIQDTAKAKLLTAEALRELLRTRDLARAGLFAAQGRQARREQRCNDAEAAYKKAYVVVAEPRYLCEQAEALVCLERLDEAVDLYGRCIDELDRSPSPEELERYQSGRQRAVLALQEKRERAQKETLADQGKKPVAVERPALIPAASPSQALAKSAPERKPVYRRLSFWVGIGSGLVAATAGAITLGVLLPGEEAKVVQNKDSCPLLDPCRCYPPPSAPKCGNAAAASLRVMSALNVQF